MLTRLLEQVVRCLLIEPNPESALNEEAGRLFMEDYQVCVCLSNKKRHEPEPRAGAARALRPPARARVLCAVMVWEREMACARASVW